MNRWTHTGLFYTRPDATVSYWRGAWCLRLRGRLLLDADFRRRVWPTAEAAMAYADRRLRDSDETKAERPRRMG